MTGAGATAEIRAWLDEHGNDWSERTTMADALRAVLDLHVESMLSNCTACPARDFDDSIIPFSKCRTHRVIATALGVGTP